MKRLRLVWRAEDSPVTKEQTWNLHQARPHSETPIQLLTASSSVQNSPLGSVPTAIENVHQGSQTWDRNILGCSGSQMLWTKGEALRTKSRRPRAAGSRCSVHSTQREGGSRGRGQRCARAWRCERWKLTITGTTE